MNPTRADDVRDLLASAGQEMGRHFDVRGEAGIRLVSKLKPDVEDSVDVFVVRTRPRSDDSVLILSAARYPESVIAAADRAARIADNLPPDLAETVLQPEYRGRHNGRSFAIYPCLGTLSRNRLVRFVQKRLLRGNVLDWTLEFAACSRRPVEEPEQLEERFLSPLAYLAEEAGASDALRHAASKAAQSLQEPGFVPVSVAQHGDFWQDNILLNHGWPSRRGRRFAFSVIDWGASEPSGYPFIDFLRYGLSSTRNTAWITAGLRAQRERLNLPREAVLPHVCAGIGWLGMHRGQFPLPRYLGLAETLFANTMKLAA